MVKASNETDWADWVRQIAAADPGAEEELFRRYKDGIAIIIGRIVRNESAAEDLFQETFRIVLEKIRNGHVREPERLSGFICSVARNVAIEYIRRARRDEAREEIGDTERLYDERPDQFKQLLQKERAEIVQQVIAELKVERDREVLSRYYIAEEDKDQICAELGLTNLQFNTVISRALKRYKELYLKRFGQF